MRERVSRWEKFRTVAEVAIAVFAAVFTFTFNQRQLDQNKILNAQSIEVNRASSVAAFVPFLNGESDPAQQQAAISAIYTIGYRDAAIEIARLNPSKGAIAALHFIAASGDTMSRTQAMAALHGIQQTGSKVERILSDSVLLKVQEATSPDVDAQWAVVTGGFRSRSAAAADARAATRRGILSYLVFRNGYYRTVVFYANEVSARAALSDIHGRIRETAYLVDWKRWCPSPTRDRYNAFVCTPSEEDAYDTEGADLRRR